MADKTLTRSERIHRRKLLRSALGYAKRGWQVLPLHGVTGGICDCRKGRKCNAPGKHPITKNGVLDATANPRVIRGWWMRHPTANIGLATGMASGLVVVDVDPRNGGRETRKQLIAKHGRLPKTPRAKTGGGGVHYFFYCDHEVNTAHRSAGIDLQAKGAYVVMPPSSHVSGSNYAWAAGRDPEVMALRELPEPWLAGLSARNSERPSRDVQTVGEGERNTYLTTVAGKLRAAGLDQPALLAALNAENIAKCDPPLDETEVQKIAGSISGYSVGAGAGSGDAAEELAQLVLKTHFADGKHLVYAPDRQFWSFRKTHWRPLGEKTLQGTILRTLQSYAGRRNSSTAGLIGQVSSLLSFISATDEDILRFKELRPPVVNCLNGELWIGPDGKADFRQHAAESYLRHCLDIEYDPHAKCPKFDQAMADIFDGDPKLSRMWLQLTGYIIQPDRRTPLIVICRGSGGNGKTALVQTIVRLLGNDHVAAMPVDEIERSRFAIGSFLDKLLFLDDDVKAGAKLPDGQLKRLSEAKTMTGERKYGDTFSFTATALPMLLCNNPPSLADLSNGMRRRLLVVPFDRTFSEEEIDRDLFPYILEHEMSGVLNRALEGLQSFIQNGWQLDRAKSTRRATDSWLTEANPLPAFIGDSCEPEGKCWLADLYPAFQSWCEENGISRVQQKPTFKRNLVNSGFHVVHGNRGDRVIGLRLRLAAP